MGLLTIGRDSDVETSYSRRPGIPPRVIIALVSAAISIFSYLASSSYNPITGQKQHVSISREQEIALGLQAAPSMERQYGGGWELRIDRCRRRRHGRVGERDGCGLSLHVLRADG